MSSLIERLQNAVDDPMWADHAEVSKKLLQEAVAALQPGVPDECSASGQSCSYRPDGQKGEMQCRHCGKPKPLTLPLSVRGVMYDLPEPVWQHIIDLQLWIEKKVGHPVEWRALHMLSE